MNVIINEFEVVAEPPPPQRGAEVTVPPPPEPSTPLDIERILEHQAARQARLWAH